LIDVLNGNLDKALREHFKKQQENRISLEVKKRAHYMKPCEKRNLKEAQRMANRRKYIKMAKGKKRSKRELPMLFATSFK
jgi:ribosomal protein S21